MSFLAHDKPNIGYGDTVVLYLNWKTYISQIVEKGGIYQTVFGAVKHDELIGKPFGMKFNCKKGYVHILRPTPELWTLCLPHRTQILYFNDIAMIISHLDLKPGSVVIEAGTGSGSLTHSLARTIASHGKVFTFDFHEARSKEAAAEFQSHGLADVIVANHRDVCTDGFPSELDGQADGVFLDLPHPWEAIEAAQRCLKLKGRLCCFSPCIEQVQKSCEAMRRQKFIEIRTVETILRPYAAKEYTFAKLDQDQNGAGDSEGSVQNFSVAYPVVNTAGHTGFLTFATKF